MHGVFLSWSWYINIRSRALDQFTKGMIKMNEPDLTPGFEYLMKENHQGLVHGVLKRLNILPNNPQYDDLVQEGFIRFAQKYIEYDEEKTNNSLISYLYQGVYWYLLDLLRKQQRQNNHTEMMSAEQDGWEDELLDDSEGVGEVNDRELLNQLWLNCTHDQRKFLCSSFNEGMNVTDISRKYRVSRKTVYKWKQGVQKEYLKIR